jgi:hypothetical protein
MKKRGSEKYYILMSMILGLLVLSISIYFIFNEYFNKDDLDWEACRQSIYLRAISPDFHKIADLKDAMPLKCKTEVIKIDTAKPEVVYGKISDVIAAGWHLFGEGEFDIVPRSMVFNKEYCMVFARVSYTDKAIKEISDGKFAPNMNGFVSYYHRTKIQSKDMTYEQYIPIQGLQENQLITMIDSNTVIISNQIENHPSLNRRLP